MSTGDISDKKKRQFADDLQQILKLSSSWLQKNEKYIQNVPKVFEAAPIASSFDINSLLAGVRDHHLTRHDKDHFLRVIESTIGSLTNSKKNSNQISGNTVVQNYDSILRNIEGNSGFISETNIIKILNSISSGVPDAIYLANAGLSLGRSPLLKNKNVFVVQSPMPVERQVETAFTRSLSIQMGSFPIEMKRVYEGMADSVTALVNYKGKKQNILLGIKSSRTDPKVYKDLVNVARALKVVPEFPKDVVVIEVNKKMQEHAYHMDIATLTLPNSKICIGEGNNFFQGLIIRKMSLRNFSTNIIMKSSYH